ncbi:MAG: NAD(P)-dependent glycerol-3-phosphate dehydrogenase [Deltaproteobacteria bacterium]|nr:NAD(P)-dependent glycerol-3-phosphate dehydrogenase [Deltaproteobacteria bacterium]
MSSAQSAEESSTRAVAKKSIAVLGAGSWGTALAKHFADVGHDVRLWARRTEQAKAIESARENAQYLPGAILPPNLRATSDLGECLEPAEIVLSVVPSHTTRETWQHAAQLVPKTAPILGASKGIENETLELMSEVLHDLLPSHPLAFLAGPSFAKEVAAHAPTAVVIASKDLDVARTIQAAMSSDWLRAYVTTDVIGAEIGGSLKNVIAIACGCADGLGFGHNTRAAIITRGLAEISRMAVKLGADPLTLAGLSGMGDLVLTCTGDLSRNRRVGLGLGAGKKLDDILREMGQVAEGVKTARSAFGLSQREGVPMPITEEVYRILYEDKPPRQSVLDLMRRDLKHEKG